MSLKPFSDGADEAAAMTERDEFYEAQDGTTYYGEAARRVAKQEAQDKAREDAVWIALARFMDTPQDDPEFWLEYGALRDAYAVSP